MRRLVLGNDSEGRSCAVEHADLVFNTIPGIVGSTIAKLFSTDQSPPPPCPPGLGKKVENGLPPGHVSWYVIEHKPRLPGQEQRAQLDLHHRNVIDLIVVLEGEAEMLAADGAHLLKVGDSVVMEGIDHGLRPGPNGCKLMAFAIGAAPQA